MNIYALLILSVAESGVTRVSCYCDSTRTSLAFPSSPTMECLPDHEFDETTRVCECIYRGKCMLERIAAFAGKSAKNICGEIENKSVRENSPIENDI